MKNKKKGFTLVEILVVTGVFSIVIVALLAVIGSWQNSWNINKVQIDVQSQARRAMSAITEELSQTSESKVSINVSNDVITFWLPNDDYAAGVFTWGDQIQYSLIVEPTGISQLVRTNLTTAQTGVLASYINGIQFTLASGIVSMQLTINKTPQGGLAPVTMQLDSQVSLRNL